ncbi:MAG TPA: hypothetical protein VJ184_04065 [Chryseolinea sp.]|nr:hypothetical protein [Chryseolinea sp.]
MAGGKFVSTEIPSSEVTTPSLATSYPSSVLNENQPAYPAPVNPTETDNFHPDTVTIPKPGSDTGVVTGKILLENSEMPYLNSLLLLGEVSNPDTEGYPPLVGFSLETDPKAIQAKNGLFVFDNIKPGEYGIVLWSPISTFLLSDLQTGDTLFVTVKAGEVSDIGIVYIK